MFLKRELKRFLLVACLSILSGSCGSGDQPCVDSIDCISGLACREEKCVVVTCQSSDFCESNLEICVPAGYLGQSGDSSVCTARCSVFNRCSEGFECRNGICVIAGSVDSDTSVGDGGSDDVIVSFDTNEPTDTNVPADTNLLTDTSEPKDTNEPTDTNLPTDINEPKDTNICVPNCGTHVCGMDPVCSKQDCGTCDGTDKCVDGECIWQADTYVVNCSDGMCLIPAGSFWMGCNEAVDSQCSDDEKPYHEVTLSAYYIDKTEVTQGEYKKCVDAGVCGAPGCDWDPSDVPNQPVVCTNWESATAYCVWAGKRLPTEAEWEKAARGTDGRKYPWGNETATCDYAVMIGCPGDAMVVCSKSPAGDSPYGLCNMSGNVLEWVSDLYGSDYYIKSPNLNPTGPVSGSIRVSRGGGFVGYDDYLRASDRNYADSSYDGVFIGFRCAMDAL